MTAPSTQRLVEICRLEEIDREGGVAALVDGDVVAVFRTYADDVFALDNYDPFGRASVLSRGIIGTRGERDVVTSPLHKQAFDLRTGVCLDDETVRVTVHPVVVRDGVVHVETAPA